MFRRYLPVWFVTVFGLLSVSAMTAMPASGATQIAMVLPPWYDEQKKWQTVAALEVPIVRHGFDSSIVIVDISGRPEIRALLRDKSLFLIDSAMAGACLALAG